MQNIIELDGIWWKKAKVIEDSLNNEYQRRNESGFEQPRFDGYIWLYGIWDGPDWYSGLWLNGTWIDGGNWKANKVIKISPKSYERPKLTLSLNYAKYD